MVAARGQGGGKWRVSVIIMSTESRSRMMKRSGVWTVAMVHSNMNTFNAIGLCT